MDLLSDLNSKQQEAVKRTEGFVRVIAGAGSGKTKLLVSRYAYLVSICGVDPQNILCVTFTNKAAAEMKKRVRALIGEGYDTGLICTYHGFCARLLREDPEKLFLTRNFQIIDGAQQRSILGDIYQKYELKLDNASFGSILKRIALYKATHAYVPRICSPENIQISETIEDLYSRITEEYMQRQKAIYALDFEDLLQFALYLLRTDPEVREKWQNRLNYIQVDEFQDSSGTEMMLIDILSEKYANLLIVGDPDQNIYEWRGSSVELLVDFDQTHIPTETIYLNQNYRSTPEILRCANSVIAHNKMRLEKELYTRLPGGDAVMHFHSKNDEDELKTIVDNIKTISKRQKNGFSDIAILYRSAFLSRMIEKKLAENNIPYEIYGGVRFFDRMEIQDLIAFLRHIAFEDDLSFIRIINKPRRKFGRVKLNALRDMQEAYNDATESHRTLYRTLIDYQEDKAFAGSGIKRFIDATEAIRAQKNKLRIPEIVNRVCCDFGYEKYIRELGDEERLDNLTEFKRIADEFENSFGEELSLEAFLQQIALQKGEGTGDTVHAVNLMTIHAAKGLEFPVVFVVGLTEGIFPSSKAIEERKEAGLEEERRLCYVAITRARENLFLMDSEGLSQSGMQKLPSRFLHEIGEENYTRIGVISDEAEQEAESRKRTNAPSDSKTVSANAGQEVEHPVFGRGKILSVNQKTGSCLVQFERFDMPRNMMLRYFEKTAGQIEERTEVPEEKRSKQPEPQHAEEAAEKAALTKRCEETQNLWKREDVPKTGWFFTGFTDLGAPCAVCQMCGHQIIRYVHHMHHPAYGSIDAGCVCAGKMEGDIEAAKQREREAKNKAARRENFQKRKWKTSRGGNPYTKIKEHVIVLYERKNSRTWKYSIDNVFCAEVFETAEEAKTAAFEALERKMY